MNQNVQLEKLSIDEIKTDILDELLKMTTDEVVELVKNTVADYIEEGVHQEVAKIKAMEDIVLWYCDDDNKELKLRKLFQNRQF